MDSREQRSLTGTPTSKCMLSVSEDVVAFKMVLDWFRYMLKNIFMGLMWCSSTELNLNLLQMQLGYSVVYHLACVRVFILGLEVSPASW